VDPTILVALVVAAQVCYTAWVKYKTERPKGVTALSGAVDERLKILLHRQEEEIDRLRNLVVQLQDPKRHK
jgi:hypothetical protein